MTISMNAGEIDIHNVVTVTLEPLHGDNKDYLDIVIASKEGVVRLSLYGVEGEKLTLTQEV